MSVVARPTWNKLLLGFLVALFGTAVYLYAFPAPNLFYAALVLAHVAIGVPATFLLIARVLRAFRTETLASRAGWLLALAGALLGVVLIFIGTSRPEWNWLYAHIVISLAAIAVLVA